MTAPLIEVDSVSRAFWQTRRGRPTQVMALRDVSLRPPSEGGMILSVVGESGSGKSTLARLILGLDRPTSGSVRYRGREVSTLRGRTRTEFRREVQAVFQDPYAAYNPFYTVDRVMWQPLRRFGLVADWSQALGRIEESLRAVDLRPRDVLGRYPHQLSGGERQRIMLARLYLIRPRIIVADEPVSMIDAALRTMFLNILLNMQEQGVASIFITHNLQTAYYLGGDCLVLYQGSVVEHAPIDRVLNHPAHPYTKTLIDSIPPSDPHKRWVNQLSEQAVESGSVATHTGCPFAPRCPQAMKACLTVRPPLLRLEDDHEVACLLYDEELASGREKVPELPRRA